MGHAGLEKNSGELFTESTHANHVAFDSFDQVIEGYLELVGFAVAGGRSGRGGRVEGVPFGGPVGTYHSKGPCHIGFQHLRTAHNPRSFSNRGLISAPRDRTGLRAGC